MRKCALARGTRNVRSSLCQTRSPGASSTSTGAADVGACTAGQASPVCLSVCLSVSDAAGPQGATGGSAQPPRRDC
jgi:hypothetical protein